METARGSAGRVKLIGLGDPLRPDDAAGIEVARRVRAAAPTDVDVIELRGDPIALLDAWRDAQLAIVVDTVRAGTAPTPCPSATWSSWPARSTACQLAWSSSASRAASPERATPCPPRSRQRSSPSPTAWCKSSPASRPNRRAPPRPRTGPDPLVPAGRLSGGPWSLDGGRACAQAGGGGGGEDDNQE